MTMPIETPQILTLDGDPLIKIITTAADEMRGF